MGHMTVRPVIGILALALPILALALPTLAPAATYCVATADQLRNALQSAATSAGSDQIRIRSGTYGAPGLPGTQAQYELMLTGNGDLDISGGWTDAACSQQDPRAEVTILEAWASAASSTSASPTPMASAAPSGCATPRSVAAPRAAMAAVSGSRASWVPVRRFC